MKTIGKFIPGFIGSNKDVKDTKNQIEINKLKNDIDAYKTENQTLIENQNCSEDGNQEQINQILEKGERVINRYSLFKSADLSIDEINKLNELKDLFESIKNRTKILYLKQLEICKKDKIIKDGNYRVVENTKLNKNDLYYKYDSETKTVTLLGHYTTSILYTFSTEKPMRVFKFINNGKIVDVDEDKEILIKDSEPVNPEYIELTVPSGGKPRRTRRHKNKKRRSSKQQKSKK